MLVICSSGAGSGVGSNEASVFCEKKQQKNKTKNCYFWIGGLQWCWPPPQYVHIQDQHHSEQ